MEDNRLFTWYSIAGEGRDLESSPRCSVLCESASCLREYGKTLECNRLFVVLNILQLLKFQGHKTFAVALGKTAPFFFNFFFTIFRTYVSCKGKFSDSQFQIKFMLETCVIELILSNIFQQCVGR